MKRRMNSEAIKARIEASKKQPKPYPSTDGLRRYEADRRGYSAAGGERWVADQRYADGQAAKTFWKVGQ